MRIRRTVLAPVILVAGSLMASPALALTSVAAPAGAAVTAGAAPHIMIFHG